MDDINNNQVNMDEKNLMQPTGSPGSNRSAKIIFSIFAICVLLGIVVLFVLVWHGNDRSTIVSLPNGQTVAVNVTAIERVILLDAEAGAANHVREKGIEWKTNEDFIKHAQSIDQLVRDAKQIDTAQCPRDFAEAYYRHIAAWSTMGYVIANKPDIQSEGEAMLEGFMRGLGGDITGGVFEKEKEFKDFAKSYQQAQLGIKNTFEEVEALAVKYGARISK